MQVNSRMYLSLVRVEPHRGHQVGHPPVRTYEFVDITGLI